jgi:hypothetical protein
VPGARERSTSARRRLGFQDFNAEPNAVTADRDSAGTSDDTATVGLLFLIVTAERTHHSLRLS